jgi:hypothetical protein
MLVWLRQPSRFSRVAALSDRLRTHLFALPGVSVVPALIACAVLPPALDCLRLARPACRSVDRRQIREQRT